MVGDSIRYSLSRITLLRLGKTEFALFSEERFFRSELAEELAGFLAADIAPFVQVRGLAIVAGGERRANRIQVIGAGKSFWQMGGVNPPDLEPGEAVINRRLADRLQLSEGDEFLLRIEKHELMPSEAPLSTGESGSTAIRLEVKKIAGDEEFGRFSLKTSQLPPLNVFLSIEQLGEMLNLPGRANGMLAASPDVGRELTLQNLGSAMKLRRLEDSGLELRIPEGGRDPELLSDRVFLEEAAAKAALDAWPDARGILTYFVNSLESGGKSTPYSFAAAPGEPLVPSDMDENEVIISEWLGKDLDAGKGDTLIMRYFVPGVDGLLEEKASEFLIRAVVPVGQRERDLMPAFPGLAGVENCRDWRPGIPIDLSRIRGRDEAYWYDFGGTPKAYISLGSAQSMWGNRFGKLTSVRYPGGGSSMEEIGAAVMERLAPEAQGLYFRPVREEGLKAGVEAVDFSRLFIGFSFFLLSAALLLTAMLFSFSSENRASEHGLLLALGFTHARARNVIMAEGAVIAFLGAVLGSICGIAYNRGILYGLETLWKGAVGASSLVLYVKPSTVLTGFILSAAAALLAMGLVSRKQAARSITQLQQEAGQSRRSGAVPRIWPGLVLSAACVLGVSGFLISVGAGRDREAAGLFFIAGALLLLAGLSFFRAVLVTWSRSFSDRRIGLIRMGFRSAARRRKRSLLTVALLACGIFTITAVSASRRDSIRGSERRESGTGGFLYYAEADLPVFYDLAEEDGRRNAGFDQYPSLDFVGFRVRDGDDASCLNLNRIEKPGLLGVAPEELAERGAFSFVETEGWVDRDNPWSALQQDMGPGILPGIADQTVIIWSLGKAIGDTIDYMDERGRSFKIRLVAGLANSVFQGNVLISEKAFIEHFPSTGGKRVFLVEASGNDLPGLKEELSNRFRDFGLELMTAAERLEQFNRVENTYLSIFLFLGGLGLMLSSVGLGVMVLRNVQENRRELALMRALGFLRKDLRKGLLAEHGILLGFGLFLGVFSGLLAALPSLRSSGSDTAFLFLAAVLAAVALNGLLWITGTGIAATSGDFLTDLRNE
jgi:putative ABC transport system permease protein